MNSLQYDFIDVRSMTDEQYSCTASMMSVRRWERLQRLRREDDSRRTVAAELLARNMISERLGIAPRSIIIDSLDSGQPVVRGLPVCISLSHSGSCAMCAVSDKPVGADIEIVSGRGEKLIDRICSPGERAYILASGDFDPIRFLEVWTAKEACLKRTGKGLSGGMESTVVADASGLLRHIDGGTLISSRYGDAVFSVIG